MILTVLLLVAVVVLAVADWRLRARLRSFEDDVSAAVNASSISVEATNDVKKMLKRQALQIQEHLRRDHGEG